MENRANILKSIDFNQEYRSVHLASRFHRIDRKMSIMHVVTLTGHSDLKNKESTSNCIDEDEVFPQLWMP
jgi:hypothetical protein